MDISQFINSKDIRRHLQSIGYKFSPLEAAWLINQNHSATMKEKHAAWLELIETTADCAVRHGRIGHSDRCRIDFPSLHQFLHDYVRLEDRVIHDFCEQTVSPNGKPYIIRIKYRTCEDSRYRDPYYYSDTFYSSYPAALEAVKDYDDVEEIIFQKFEVDSEKRANQLYLAPDLRIMRIDPTATLSDAELDLFSVFDLLWFDFPTPFKKGDIVYDRQRLLHGPLCSGPFVMRDDGVLGWLSERHRERLKEGGDTSDMCTGGYFLNEDGCLYSETSNSNYMDLEFYPVEQLTGVQRILKALGNFLKDEIDASLFARTYHQIRMAEYAAAAMPRDYTDEGMILAGLKDAKARCVDDRQKNACGGR